MCPVFYKCKVFLTGAELNDVQVETESSLNDMIFHKIYLSQVKPTKNIWVSDGRMGALFKRNVEQLPKLREKEF